MNLIDKIKWKKSIPGSDKAYPRFYQQRLNVRVFVFIYFFHFRYKLLANLNAPRPRDSIVALRALKYSSHTFEFIFLNLILKLKSIILYCKCELNFLSYKISL